MIFASRRRQHGHLQRMPHPDDNFHWVKQSSLYTVGKNSAVHRLADTPQHFGSSGKIRDKRMASRMSGDSL